MNEKRTLKAWTKEEREQLEKCKKSGHYNVINLCFLINDDYVRTCGTGNMRCESPLGEKYKKLMDNKYDDSAINHLVQDVIDYFAGTAKFPGLKKYYVFLAKSKYPFLIEEENGTFDWSDYPEERYKYEFTEDEIKAIDPRYMAFALEV
ncbi:hypothetical protein [Companilactobacillus bobalius]|uniref:DUF1642 domain-containing protein n=2 Tax=Companilactobacillus bobalius TaxID=2801451 RepID=A0A202F4B5_9LACO|nr:hypothetical protein [Companilactobacillus bobalius]KAE9560108.1 hypothetical protein ATN92_07720 [Companilactobacillus bobalius]KRK84919.1 hypothetical protein FC78_GL001158 [Companilactobacillus bobalius DSM 19674]OVE95260.1 hypothetical protein LKACC16343_02644 [Companilactobacillus bobalius]GEO58685.1 hypothetical protein LBO01_18140 [Companilactobacillus paralimentarius]